MYAVPATSKFEAIKPIWEKVVAARRQQRQPPPDSTEAFVESHETDAALEVANCNTDNSRSHCEVCPGTEVESGARRLQALFTHVPDRHILSQSTMTACRLSVYCAMGALIPRLGVSPTEQY
jgi:hypothetical protein